MFKTEKEKTDTASEHSITADDVFFDKPVVYAYDAWAESELMRKEKGYVATESDAKTDDGAEGPKHASANSAIKDAMLNKSASALRAGNGNSNGNTKAPAEVAAR